jgi:transposase
VRGRQLLARLGLLEPWQGRIEASLRLIDELDREIGDCERELRRLGTDHRYVPVLCTVPGISWVLADTIAAEIGDVSRFPSPRKLAGYGGLCPRLHQSSDRDLRGPLVKQGTANLRWALVEAAARACTHPTTRDRYQQTKQGSAKQRGPRSPRSTSPTASPKRSGTSSPASNPSRPKAPPTPGRLTAPKEMRHRSELQSAFSSHQEAIER